jgi:MoaA/NifB/PqqE/SkfB family radical SAM enzyme/2-polyprenyl-3-methyl-5-hydroxy-6-metoxy-1,4-benzoquinol methylase
MTKINTDIAYAFINRSLHLFNSDQITQKPLLLYNTAKYVARYLVTKENLPWEAHLSINTNCNLSCEHCFARAFRASAEQKSNRKELSTEEIIAAIEEYIEHGIFSFTFQGGEVLLRPDLERIIKACKPYRSYITVITNGVLFSDEWAKKFKAWGVDMIAVSIDSMEPGLHDQFRKKEGVFDKAVNATQIAKRNGLSVNVFTTVTKQNLYSDGIKKIHEYCHENGFMNQLFIGIPIGQWANKTEILIDEKDHVYLEELTRKYDHKVRRDITPHLMRSGCPAVKEGFYMTSCGEVLPCPFIHIALGDIRQSSIKDILARASTVDELREQSAYCLIGENKDFIKKYGEKTYTATYSPLDGKEVFGYGGIPKRSVPLAGDGSSKWAREHFLEVNRDNPDKDKDFKLYYHTECMVCHTPVPTRPIAHVREHEYKNTTSLVFPVYRCPKCELVYLNPRPDVSELKTIYPPDYYSYHLSMDNEKNTAVESLVKSVWYKMARQSRQQRIVPHLESPQGRPLRILDIGCGTGAELENIKMFLPSDTETYGVEIDPDTVKTAENRGHKVYAGRFEDVEIPENYFDLIVSFHVIEHVERPDLFLRKCMNALTDKGIALIETPNTDSLDYQVLQEKHWGGYHAPRHWQLFNIETFKTMAKEINANIVDYGPYNTAVFWNWSCHSLSSDMMPGKVADALFPPISIFYGGLQPFVILGFFSVFERSLMKLFKRANCLWVVFNKDASRI